MEGLIWETFDPGEGVGEGHARALGVSALRLPINEGSAAVVLVNEADRHREEDLLVVPLLHVVLLGLAFDVQDVPLHLPAQDVRLQLVHRTRGHEAFVVEGGMHNRLNFRRKGIRRGRHASSRDLCHALDMLPRPRKMLHLSHGGMWPSRRSGHRGNKIRGWIIVGIHRILGVKALEFRRARRYLIIWGSAGGTRWRSGTSGTVRHPHDVRSRPCCSSRALRR